MVRRWLIWLCAGIALMAALPGCFPEKAPVEAAGTFPLSAGLTAYLADHPDAFPGTLHLNILPDGRIAKQGSTLSLVTRLVIRDPENKYGITQLDDLMGYLSSLQEVTVEGTGIRSLPLAGRGELTRVECVGSHSLTRLDLSGCAKLLSLKATDCALEQVVLGSHPLLGTVHLAGNRLESLDLSGCPALWNLDLSRNRLMQLDISSFEGLSAWDVTGQASAELHLRLRHDQLGEGGKMDGNVRRSYSDVDFLQTEWVGSVSATDARVWVKVSSMPGAVRERGVFFSKETDDPYVGNGIRVKASQEKERFLCWLDGLEPETTYHVRGYLSVLVQDVPTYYYGEVLSFTTASTAAPALPDGERLISFADEEVRKICVGHWDADGDGELSFAEASAVSDISEAFQRQSIRSFEELRFFTGLKRIPPYAFEACTSLSKIAFPSSLESIGEYAFAGCSSLKMLDIPPLETIESGVFAGSGLVFADVPEGVKALASFVFDNCRELGSVHLPSSLESIGKNAFYGCVALNDVQMGNHVREIDDHAFDGAAVLASIALPGSLRRLGRCVFSDCMSLRGLALPEGMEEWGRSSVYHSGIETITLPASLQRISSLALEGCRGLKTLTVRAKTPPVVFQETEAAMDSSAQDQPLGAPETLEKVKVPDLFAYQHAVGWADFAHKLH